MFGIISIVSGFLCLALAFVMFKQRQYFTTGVDQVVGRIVSIELRVVDGRHGPEEEHHPIVEYYYRRQTWRFESEYDVRKYNHHIGTPLAVYINPNHPTLVCSEKDIKSKTYWILMLLGLGIFMPLFGVFSDLEFFQEIISGEFDYRNIDPFFTIVCGVVLISLFLNIARLGVILNSKTDEKNAWGLSCNAYVVEDKFEQNRC